MSTINFELRDRPDKAGFCRVRVCIQDRGDRRYTTLPIKLQPKDWDKDNQRVKSNHPQAGVINDVIRLRRADLQANMAKQSLAGSISLDQVAGRKVEKTLFRKFAGDCLHGWEKTKSKNSIRCYSSMLKQASLFDRDAMVEDITPDWLKRYEAYSRQTCGDGGTLKRIAFVSVIMKEAMKQGMIERDPFVIYKKPPKINPPKIWLTTPELLRIEKLASETKRSVLKNTGYWFLLSCYTGLRYSDIEKFDHKKLIQEGRLILYTQKTGEVVSIKITRKIKELVKITSKLQPVYRNQNVNVHLKAIAHLCKIDKALTFHSGRHTFAVQCANRGISIEVTGKLLGHSDLKVTAVYYKIINARIDEEMKKWEK